MSVHPPRQSGVVLLEVLVAVSLFAISAVVIMQTISASLMALKRAEHRLALVEFAADCLGQQHWFEAANPECMPDVAPRQVRGIVRLTAIAYSQTTETKGRSALVRARVEAFSSDVPGEPPYVLESYYIAPARRLPHETP